MIRAPLPRCFDALKAAAREVGSVQIQNRGTVAGNLCNASPAADGVPPLLALDAEVELASAVELRRMPLSQFLTGNRKTMRRPDEILAAMLCSAENGRSRLDLSETRSAAISGDFDFHGRGGRAARRGRPCAEAEDRSRFLLGDGATTERAGELISRAGHSKPESANDGAA